MQSAAQPHAQKPQAMEASFLAQLSPHAYVKRLQKNVRHKVQNGGKLSAVELHLAKNFSQLERAYFAPTVTSTLLLAGRAFVRPVLAFLLISAGLFTAARYYPTNPLLTRFAVAGDSVLIRAGIDIADDDKDSKMDFVQLALVLAEDKDAPSDNSLDVLDVDAAPTSITLPKPIEDEAEETANADEANEPEPVIEKTPENLDTLSAETPAEIVATAYTPSFLTDVERYSDMRHRRNLVKFISGLIAAFRPSVADSSATAKHIVELSARENIDPLYVAAVIAIESRFSAQAESHVGALGLMQLMPGTAKMVAKSAKADGHSYRHLVDPRTNIKLGITYLKQLENRYRGNKYLALSAYNWGPGYIDKGRRIPRSVQKYSRTVLDRTRAWRRHFDNAIKQADALAMAYQKDNKS